MVRSCGMEIASNLSESSKFAAYTFDCTTRKKTTKFCTPSQIFIILQQKLTILSLWNVKFRYLHVFVWSKTRIKLFCIPNNGGNLSEARKMRQNCGISRQCSIPLANTFAASLTWVRQSSNFDWDSVDLFSVWVNFRSIFEEDKRDAHEGLKVAGGVSVNYNNCFFFKTKTCYHLKGTQNVLNYYLIKYSVWYRSICR